MTDGSYSVAEADVHHVSDYCLNSFVVAIDVALAFQRLVAVESDRGAMDLACGIEFREFFQNDGINASAIYIQIQKT